MFDPIELTEKIEKIVLKNDSRKYYRLVRAARFYGGIASSDCVGCNLKCVFCWSGKPRDEPEKYGKFYTPREVFNALVKCAERNHFTKLRITGNEPTIGRKHLIKLLELVDQTNYLFILETNGILIGHDKSYAKDLSKFDCLHVRVSIKGTSENLFSKLTLAKPEAFKLQLKALENLLDHGVSCHPAVMLSFSKEEECENFLKRLEEIDKTLVKEIEEEYVKLYPTTIKRLKEMKIRPLKFYT